MATLNIKDPRVHELAADLAKRRGSSMTAVIRGALEEAMAAELARHERATLEQILEIARRSAAKQGPFLTGDDLYDENGLPR